MDATATVGPVEWVALTFPGRALDPRVVRPLAELVAAGTVRVVDAVVLHKSPGGALVTRELEELEEEAFAAVDGEVGELLSQGDLAAIATGLLPDSTALVLVWENRWALELAATVRAAGGVLQGHDRIPAERVDTARRASLQGAPA